MSDKVSLTIEMSVEERDQFETQAHERGYDALSDYFVALAASDTDTDEDELSDEQILQNIVTGLKEALRGETYPIETLRAKMNGE